MTLWHIIFEQETIMGIQRDPRHANPPEGLLSTIVPPKGLLTTIVPE